MKLASSLVVLTMLCGPALADPATAQLKIAVTSNNTVRSYDLALVEHTCGEVRHEQGTSRDEIKTCMKPDGAKLRLEVEWYLREGDRMLHTSATMLTDHNGKLELHNDDAKLVVNVQ